MIRKRFEHGKHIGVGEELGLVAVLADEADGLLGGLGADVVECCGDHWLVSWCWVGLDGM